jgi:hypothetical protein
MTGYGNDSKEFDNDVRDVAAIAYAAGFETVSSRNLAVDV